MWLHQVAPHGGQTMTHLKASLDALMTLMWDGFNNPTLIYLTIHVILLL